MYKINKKYKRVKSFLLISLIVVFLMINFTSKKIYAFSEIPVPKGNTHMTGLSDEDAKRRIEEENKRLKRIQSFSSEERNTYLKDLKIINGKLDKSFDKEKVVYILTIDKNAKYVEIIADPESKTSKVEGIGKFNIDNLKSEKEIKVISKSRLERSYILKIIKSKEYKLSSIDIIVKNEGSDNFSESGNVISKSNWNIPFDPNILDYSIYLDKKASKFLVKYKASENIYIEKEEENKNDYYLIKVKLYDVNDRKDVKNIYTFKIYNKGLNGINSNSNNEKNLNKGKKDFEKQNLSQLLFIFIIVLIPIIFLLIKNIRNKRREIRKR